MTPPDRPPARRSVDPVLLMLAVVVGVAGPLIGSGIGGRTLQLAVFWPVTGLLEVLLFATGWRVARNRALPLPHRRMWGAMGLSGLLYAIGVLLQIPTVVRRPGDVAAVLGGPAYSVFVLAGTLIVVAALLTSPLGLRTRRERLRFWLDTATVMIASATVGGYATLLSNSGGDTGSGQVLQLVIGPTSFLVGVFAAVKLLLSEAPPFTFWAGMLGLLGGALEGVIRGARPQFVQHDRIAWELGLTVVVMALLTASARVQLLHTRAGASSERREARRPYSLLPYAAITVTYLLLIAALIREGLTTPSWLVVVGAVSITAVVVARQVTAFTDNARLLAALDTKVTELHAALGDRDRLAGQLHHQAYHDPLTGLANRALFRQRLGELIGTAPPGDLAVLLIDLDDFKPVNDRLGHAAGDAVLVEVAARLRAAVRGGDLVARLGGDEFAVITVHPADGGHAPALAARIVDAVCPPIAVATTEVSVSASVGVATAGAGRTADAVLHDADLAMYAAKHDGRGRFTVAGAASFTS